MKESSKGNFSSKLFTRRQFLKSSLVLTAGITIAGCGDVLVSPNKPVSSKGKIVIVGAGLSGLVAAYELSKAGFDIIILEANDRIGGRVFTIREPFSNGQFAEAGAARIPPDHNHTLHYANEFGLQLDYFYPRKGSYIIYTNGERKIIPNEQYLNYHPWTGSVTHSEYLKIRGGTDQLPKAFASYLSDKIILHSPVTTIDQNSELVEVKTSGGKIYTADRVIVTVPLTVLNKIEFIPQLSSQKMEAAKGGYNYTTSTRVFLQTGSRFWQNDNLNGWGKSDYPEEIWQPTFDQSAETGILMNYVSNERAKELDNLNNILRIDSVKSRWEAIFPGIGNNFVRGTSYSWARNEWEMGAYASPTANQAQLYNQYIGLPEGRIHFAGEHISNYHGWMQGALASGLRVINEIVGTMKLV